MSGLDLIKKAFNVLKTETEELIHHNNNVAEVDEINDITWPLEFYRSYVAKNIPVLIKGGCKLWSATKKWNSTYLMEKIGDKEVTVAVTPNGYADAITTRHTNSVIEELFVLPEERLLTFNEFLTSLQNPIDNVVYYMQRQNSNLTHDLPELTTDIDTDILWASKAFDKAPDAVNFWMGDSRAVTSLHKDPYENIYCVIDGHKDFILIPSTDLPWVPYRSYKMGTYNNVQPDSFSIELNELDKCDNEISWIAVDPLNPNYTVYPQFKNASVYHVRVHKGDCLYIPSLWFHHVRQSHECIAVNYWYDMDFDVRYCYYKMLECMCENK